ncbi:MAG: L-erythro-3,5-diaminohexanoate dehydrogenase [Bacillota bacterium]
MMGCPFGTHRAVDPAGSFPQPAWRLDNSVDDIYDNEILIDVEVLNIDSASFMQMKVQSGGDPAKIAGTIADTVSRRGKQHNPVTGSGGMFTGRVSAIGCYLKGVKQIDLREGDCIASLVSLSLTPLKIERIKKVCVETGQVEVSARAILFETGIYARLPADIPHRLALAALDVAGAPAQTARLVRPGDTVMVIGGGGKSGLFCLYESRKRAGTTGTVIGFGHGEKSVGRMRDLGVCDHVIQGDARDAVSVLRETGRLTGGRLCDVTINAVNVEGTELSSILATREGGVVYFFSMATSFTRAALGAEGIGRDVTMIIGNGYTRGHAARTLDILRESPEIFRICSRLYG